MDASFQFARPDPLFFVLLAVLTAASIWQISALRAVTTRGRTAAVGALRVVALAALCVLLLEPTLVRERRVPYRPSLAVAVDTSRSMGLVDGEGRSRLDKVLAYLGSPAFRDSQRARCSSTQHRNPGCLRRRSLSR